MDAATKKGHIRLTGNLWAIAGHPFFSDVSQLSKSSHLFLLDSFGWSLYQTITFKLYMQSFVCYSYIHSSAVISRIPSNSFDSAMCVCSIRYITEADENRTYREISCLLPASCPFVPFLACCEISFLLLCFTLSELAPSRSFCASAVCALSAFDAFSAS